MTHNLNQLAAEIRLVCEQLNSRFISVGEGQRRIFEAVSPQQTQQGEGGEQLNKKLLQVRKPSPQGANQNDHDS